MSGHLITYNTSHLSKQCREGSHVCYKEEIIRLLIQKDANYIPNLQSLYERRNYFDMLLAYKIINNFTSVPCANLLCINSGRASSRRETTGITVIVARPA